MRATQRADYNRGMLTRALIVLLLVLNLGVALWWALRTPPSSVPTTEPASTVARLQLASEANPGAAASPAAVAPVISQCVSFGPFVDAATALQAQSALKPLVLQLQSRREYAGTARSWEVFLPSFASMNEAEAAAARIADAGFTDYFVVREGESARSVALGLYRTQSTAREHLDTLIEAGFDAELEPLGAGPAEHWLDVGAGVGFDAPRAQARVQAARIETIDCARFPSADFAPAR